MWKKQHLYEKSAGAYDAFIRCLVPVYDIMQQRILDTIGELHGLGELRTVIELGVGTGNLGFRLLSTFQVRDYYGYESSAALATLAQSRLSLFRTSVRVTQQDARSSRWPAKADAVVSALTFHYFSHKDKQTVFRKAFHSLRAGGLLVVGDRVISHSPTIAKVFHGRMARSWDATTKNWTPEHRQAHQTQDDPREEPWFLEDQLEFLKKVGFADVECIWKDFNYCVFCGIKPEPQQRASG